MKTDIVRVLKEIYDVISSPTSLFVIAMAIVIIYAAKARTNFINIKKIFVDYFHVFGVKRHHIFVFWGCPALFSLSLIQADIATSDTIDTIIVFLSIVIAMYFSILAILISKQTDQANRSEDYGILLNESATIILVQVILCIICLIISITVLLLKNNLPSIVLSVLYFANYY